MCANNKTDQHAVDLQIFCRKLSGGFQLLLQKFLSDEGLPLWKKGGADHREHHERGTGKERVSKVYATIAT